MTDKQQSPKLSWWDRMFDSLCGTGGPIVKTEDINEDEMVERLQRATRDMEVARDNERRRLRRLRVAEVATLMMIHEGPERAHLRFDDRVHVAVRHSIQLVDAIDLAVKAQLDQDPPQ